MKKTISVLLAGFLCLSLFAGCSAAPKASSITVVSREDGSGTRGAFIELFGIEEKDQDGNKKDHTTVEALIAKATDTMLTQVAGNPAAIGYVSLGSLNDSVKPLQIDGTDATADNIKNGSYKIARPFYIATKGEPTGLAADFIAYILSAQGQDVIAKSYIKADEQAPDYRGTKPSGKIVVAGSSSVSPIMEKLIEAYRALNPAATIELQTNDSSTGMQSLADGTCDIGMASRELKDSEKANVSGTKIALDGIAVIVHRDNKLSALKSDEVKAIFTGAVTAWDKVGQ